MSERDDGLAGKESDAPGVDVTPIDDVLQMPPVERLHQDDRMAAPIRR